MLPYMQNSYGNPHSRTHSVPMCTGHSSVYNILLQYGWEAGTAVEEAREVGEWRSVIRAYVTQGHCSSDWGRPP